MLSWRASEKEDSVVEYYDITDLAPSPAAPRALAGNITTPVK